MDPADGDANAPFSGTPTGARPPPSAKDTPANSGDTQVAAFRRAIVSLGAARSRKTSDR